VHAGEYKNQLPHYVWSIAFGNEQPLGNGSSTHGPELALDRKAITTLQDTTRASAAAAIDDLQYVVPVGHRLVWRAHCSNGAVDLVTQLSCDGTNWLTVDTTTVAATGFGLVDIVLGWPFVRWRVDSTGGGGEDSAQFCAVARVLPLFGD